MKLFSLSLICLTVLFVATNGEAAIQINSSYLGAESKQIGSPYAQTTFTGTTIPTHTPLDVADGGSSSKNNINWSTYGDLTTLSLDMRHQRDGGVGSISHSDVFPLSFTANTAEPFKISGSYKVTDLAAGVVYMFVQLRDISVASTIFYNNQISYSTINEHFTVDGSGGDSLHDLQGSSTGMLIAGHQYQLHGSFYIQGHTNNVSGATALGNFTMTIGTPEPTSLLVWGGLMFVALTVTHRRMYAHS